MSDSPPKEVDAEQGAQSGEDENPMDNREEGTQGQGLGDFEVKEQDRWLPIANGWWTAFSSSPSALPLHIALICSLSLRYITASSRV